MLAKLGFYKDKVDGKAGMLTRSALGAYQKQHKIKVDCWPTAAALAHIQGRVRNCAKANPAALARPPGEFVPEGARRRHPLDQ